MQGHRDSLAVPLHFFRQSSRGPARPQLATTPRKRWPCRTALARGCAMSANAGRLPLRSIAEGTKISVSLLEGLERDDVSRWPSGIFRKSFVRAYAEAIGLDPDPVVREFVERYPDPLEVDVVAPVTPLLHSSSGPLSIKLTITWSGSVHHTIGRLADWKIVRLISQSTNLTFFQW